MEGRIFKCCHHNKVIFLKPAVIHAKRQQFQHLGAQEDHKFEATGDYTVK